ncbi:MAG: copper transporter [Firmicutes bacterium]|nr:copper transporter [Bacillota bacterium]
MFDFKGYLVILTSVFLALAIGLLVGISFGEDLLIYNQQEAIDKLEQKLTSQEDLIGALQKELAAWESFREYFRFNFAGKGSSEGDQPTVNIISNSASFTAEVISLMEGEKIGCRAISLHPRFIERLRSSTGQKAENLAEGIASEVGLLTSLVFSWNYAGADHAIMMGELMESGEIEVLGNWSRDIPGAVALLLYDRSAAADEECGGPETEGHAEELNYLFQELAASLRAEGYRVVIAFSGFGAPEGTDGKAKTEAGGVLPAGCGEWGEAIVDHADTFWGQITLVDLIRKGTEGHYGFGSGSRGILPAGGEGDGQS